MPDIPLTQGKMVKVDPEDFDWAKKYKWYAHKSGRNGNIVRYYAVRNAARCEGRKKLFLHCLILNAKPDEEVDHWNGNTLDCRRENLRFVTRQQNSFNAQKTKRRTSSRYKGVSHKAHLKACPWIAYIGGGPVSSGAKTPRKHLGCFPSEVAAALAYDRAARNLFGRFARLNFPL